MAHKRCQIPIRIEKQLRWEEINTLYITITGYYFLYFASRSAERHDSPVWLVPSVSKHSSLLMINKCEWQCTFEANTTITHSSVLIAVNWNKHSHYTYRICFVKSDPAMTEYSETHWGYKLQPFHKKFRSVNSRVNVRVRKPWLIEQPSQYLRGEITNPIKTRGVMTEGTGGSSTKWAKWTRYVEQTLLYTRDL